MMCIKQVKETVSVFHCLKNMRWSMFKSFVDPRFAFVDSE